MNDFKYTEVINVKIDSDMCTGAEMISLYKF